MCSNGNWGFFYGLDFRISIRNTWMRWSETLTNSWHRFFLSKFSILSLLTRQTCCWLSRILSHSADEAGTMSSKLAWRLGWSRSLTFKIQCLQVLLTNIRPSDRGWNKVLQHRQYEKNKELFVCCYSRKRCHFVFLCLESYVTRNGVKTPRLREGSGGE